MYGTVCYLPRYSTCYTMYFNVAIALYICINFYMNHPCFGTLCCDIKMAKNITVLSILLVECPLLDV